MTFDTPTNQDKIRVNIIRRRESQITILEKQIENKIKELKIQKDDLTAFQKTFVPVITKLPEVFT